MQVAKLLWKVSDFKLQTAYKIAIAHLPLRSNISLKSSGDIIEEVLPSNFRITIAETWKKLFAHTAAVKTYPVTLSLESRHMDWD